MKSYTIQISLGLDERLRELARDEGKSIHDLALDYLRRQVKLASEPPTLTDIEVLSEAWIDDLDLRGLRVGALSVDY